MKIRMNSGRKGEEPDFEEGGKGLVDCLVEKGASRTKAVGRGARPPCKLNICRFDPSVQSLI